MLVKYAKKELLDGYFAIDANVQYRVLAIASELSGGNASKAVIVRSERDMPQIIALPFDQLEIVDDSPESDWEASLATAQLSEPTIIFGYPKIIQSPDTYLRLHDQDAEMADLEAAFDAYDSYGKNVASEHFDLAKDQAYLRARQYMDEYLAQASYLRQEELDRGRVEIYLQNLEILNDYLSDRITHGVNQRTREIYRDDIKRYSSILQVFRAKGYDDISPRLADIEIS